MDDVKSNLFHFTEGAQPLPWATRIKVAIGAARGLSFLHDADVIYRDFKASNILLDSVCLSCVYLSCFSLVSGQVKLTIFSGKQEFNAKLSDFGLAKAGPTGDRTHVSTQVMGTQGYAAPEYVATGLLLRSYINHV